MHEEALRKKYPKWAHRRDYHAKKKKRRRRGVGSKIPGASASSRRSRRKKKKISQQDVTTLLLLQLLGQIQGVNAPIGKKHGENVVTGYAGAVVPDRLAPVRSQDERARVYQETNQRQMDAEFRRQMEAQMPGPREP